MMSKSRHISKNKYFMVTHGMNLFLCLTILSCVLYKATGTYVKGDIMEIINPQFVAEVGAGGGSRFGLRMASVGDDYIVSHSLAKHWVIKVDSVTGVLTTVNGGVEFASSIKPIYTCKNIVILATPSGWTSYLFNYQTEMMTEVMLLDDDTVNAAIGYTISTNEQYNGDFNDDCSKFYFPLTSADATTGIAWFNVNPTTGVLSVTTAGKRMCDPGVCDGLDGAPSFTTAVGAFAVSGDGNNVFWGRELYDKTQANSGGVLHYTNNGGTWSETWLQQATPVLGMKFGHQVSASGNRLFVASAKSGGYLFIYIDSGSGYVLEDSIPNDPALNGKYMYNSGNPMRICLVSTSPTTGGNTGTVTVYDYIVDTWTSTFVGHSTGTSAQWGSEAVACSNKYIATSDSQFDITDTSTHNDVGKLSAFGTDDAPEPPPQCVVSADCEAGTYCRAFSCYTAIACTKHTDCYGELDAGRLPYCAKNGFCKDQAASTCNSLISCNTVATRVYTEKNGVGSMSQTLTTANSGVRKSAATSMITKLRNTTTVTKPMTVFVSSVETVVMDNALFIDNDANTILGHIESVVCDNLCTVTLDTGSRRRLGGRGRDLVGNYIVTITYEVTDDAFEAIQNSTAIDDPAFAAALAAAAGVSESSVNVNSNSTGSLIITFVLTEESSGETPLDPSVFEDISSIQSSLTAITSEVTTELGLDPGDIESTAVDLCGDRDCDGFGAELCDANTGACDCPTGYWGVNCETAVTCANGGTVLGSYCVCEYPFYGARCNSTSSCDVCA